MVYSVIVSKPTTVTGMPAVYTRYSTEHSCNARLLPTGQRPCDTDAELSSEQRSVPATAPKAQSGMACCPHEGLSGLYMRDSYSCIDPPPTLALYLAPWSSQHYARRCLAPRCGEHLRGAHLDADLVEAGLAIAAPASAIAPRPAAATGRGMARPGPAEQAGR